MSPSTKAAVAAVLAVGIAGGCGGRKVQYAEVGGVVTLDGKPLRGVAVFYYPAVEGNDGLPFSTGTTDDAGRYTLTSSAGPAGAVVGQCRVTVSWPYRPRGEAADKTPGPRIPVQYTTVLDTPLIIEVKDGPQTIDLPLKR
jgi:hypothetical protein